MTTKNSARKTLADRLKFMRNSTPKNLEVGRARARGFLEAFREGYSIPGSLPFSHDGERCSYRSVNNERWCFDEETDEHLMKRTLTFGYSSRRGHFERFARELEEGLTRLKEDSVIGYIFEDSKIEYYRKSGLKKLDLDFPATEREKEEWKKYIIAKNNPEDLCELYIDRKVIGPLWGKGSEKRGKVCCGLLKNQERISQPIKRKLAILLPSEDSTGYSCLIYSSNDNCLQIRLCELVNDYIRFANGDCSTFI